MPTYDELGLREELLGTLEEEDLTRPTDLQAALIPSIRRGGNVVARASSGSGKTLAYLLGVLDRLEARSDPEPGEDEAGTTLRVLVLAATVSEAERIGVAATPYVDVLDLSISVVSEGWASGEAGASILVAAAGDVMEVVRRSGLKLDAVEAVVVDGASTIAELGALEDVDAVIDLVPRDAQRVVITATQSEPVEDLIARRVKRALRFPPEPATPERFPAAMEGTIGYVLASEREKLDLLASQLRGRDPGTAPPIVFCRTDERVATIAERLALRGFLIAERDEVEADVVFAFGDHPSVADGENSEDVQTGQTISFDVPADAATLRGRHGADRDAVVLVEPRELTHLHEIARQSKLEARPAPIDRMASGAATALERFRGEIRQAIQGEDLTAQMLILEPLFEEFTAVEVAAGLAARLRARRPATAPLPATPTPLPGTPVRRQQPEPGAGPGAAPATWARLFVGVGSRDEIRPGDLVGALAGEADIAGSKIGKIEIRDSFSIVEVQADVAERVITAVNGTTLKGRSVRVDYDRGGPSGRPAGRGASPRRKLRSPPGPPSGR